MAFNGGITFKGISSKNLLITLTTPPAIIHPEVTTEEWTIPGKDGTLYGVDGYKPSAQIVVNMALVTDQEVTDGVASYTEAYREVRNWLQGTGRLTIDDATDAYYEVQKVNITGDERAVLRYGQLQVTFTVYPYEFLNSGETGQNAGTINNPGSVCSPIYKIVGNGSGTLSVNGKAMTYTVSGTLYIDVRRMIAYDLNRVNKNNELNGNYRDLRLVSGENSVSASTGTLTVYPYWGYVL